MKRKMYQVLGVCMECWCQTGNYWQSWTIDWEVYGTKKNKSWPSWSITNEQIPWVIIASCLCCRMVDAIRVEARLVVLAFYDLYCRWTTGLDDPGDCEDAILFSKWKSISGVVKDVDESHFRMTTWEVPPHRSFCQLSLSFRVSRVQREPLMKGDR